MELPSSSAPEPVPQSSAAERGFPRLHEPGATSADLLSPSLTRFQGDRTPAFELKFLVPEEIAQQVENWAATALQRDEHALSAPNGMYDTTTLYLDTPTFDMFHRQPGHRRRKYRLRRYGQSDTVFLERKARRGDKVRKRRTLVSLTTLAEELAVDTSSAWDGDWFRSRVARRGLKPACLISYSRSAFVAHGDDGPLRVTLDRNLCGTIAGDWNLLPIVPDAPTSICNLLGNHVVCEFKFRNAMPSLFKEVITNFGLQTGSVSKYRRMMIALGLVDGEGSAHG